MSNSQPEKKPVGRPKIRFEQPAKSSQKGLKPGDERINVVTTKETIEDLKSIAYLERLMLKDVYNQAFTSYIEQYKSEHPEHVITEKLEDGKTIVTKINTHPAGA